MSDYKWIEAVFIAAVVLGIGGWQLWSVNREIAKDRAKKAEEENTISSPPLGGEGA